MTIIELKKISKVYGKGDNITHALKDVSLVIRKGEFWSVMGPSGSGKSTLLNIIGCMDKATDGEYMLNGELVNEYSGEQLSIARNQKISFIFQHFALLNDYSVYDNIVLPLNCRRMTSKEKMKKANYYMERLGIKELARKKPSQISGGQQQRVAIARALITEPEIILADEPTGALDQKTGNELMTLLKEINHEGITILLVTHDEKIASVATKKLYIEDGKCRVEY